MDLLRRSGEAEEFERALVLPARIRVIGVEQRAPLEQHKGLLRNIPFPSRESLARPTETRFRRTRFARPKLTLIDAPFQRLTDSPIGRLRDSRTELGCFAHASLSDWPSVTPEGVNGGRTSEEETVCVMRVAWAEKNAFQVERISGLRSCDFSTTSGKPLRYPADNTPPFREGASDVLESRQAKPMVFRGRLRGVR